MGSQAQRTLILVRHGQFALSSLGLTPLGKRQAARTALRLRTLPVARIHSSTMKRAYETALIIARRQPGLRPIRAHLLRECLPSWPSHRRRDSTRVTVQTMRWCRERADRAYRRYFRPPGARDECEVVVGHGNVIRYLVARALGFRKGWHRLGTSHCGVTVVRITADGRRVVQAYNDTGHLPDDMRTS